MKLFATAAAVVLSASLLTSCGGDGSGSTSESSTKQDDAPNTDPTKGWVVVEDWENNNLDTDIWKRCDGTTLMYVSYADKAGGISVVPDSTECESLAR